jgi:RNA polymerase-associated protein
MDPVSRATARMVIKRIDQDWYQLLDEISSSGEKKSARAKKLLRESLIAATPVFGARPYFMSDEFSLIDCVIAPLLWRLPSVGIDVMSQNEIIGNYAQRLFKRTAFKRSLSDAEKEMADPIK